jgi:hypothetical protein
MPQLPNVIDAYLGGQPVSTRLKPMTLRIYLYEGQDRNQMAERGEIIGVVGQQRSSSP